jgi:uncharacterized protein (TIGR03437 family)
MSVPEPIEVAPAQPSIFSIDGSGKGQGHIYRITPAGDAILAAPGAPAAAGEAIVIYSAGLGAVDPAVEAGSAASAAVLSETVNPVTVTIGGKRAAVQFSGLVPGFAGFYQVNATVPEGIPAGGQTPVTLTVAGQSSLSLWMAVR